MHEVRISKEHDRELTDKKNFVAQLNDVFLDPSVKKYTSVENITYDVFASMYGTQEYLVVTFKGGGKSVRNCEGNSLTAIFRELGKLLNGGYYDELESYENAKNRPATFFVIEED